MGPIIARRAVAARLSMKPAAGKAAFYGLLSAGLLLGAAPARAQACLEQIVQVQQQLEQVLPKPKEPPSQRQSIAAQTSAQPSVGSMAAAGVTQPDSGAWGALNEAMNLQAAGDEAGCFKALAKARALAGIK